MTAKTPPSLVPNSRFPEFRDAPEWPRRVMGRYLSESRVKGSTGEQAKKLTVKLWGKGVAEKQGAVQGSANTQYYRRRAGQFIYSKLDFLNQAFGIIPDHLDGFESTVDLPCFDIDSDLNAKFLLEYVQREQFYKVRGEIADGGRKAKRIQVETFLGCPIFAPSKAEQQKIADCLGSLDDLLAAESRKLEALRQHKQGLMQQLFPQPGGTVPRLRFPEFEDEAEWEEAPLGTIADIKLGKMLSGEKHTTGRLLPYLNNIAVRWNAVDISNLPQMYFEDDELDRFGLKAGDIVVCEGGEPGRSAVWDGRLPDLKFQKAIHRVRFNVPFVPHLLVSYLEAIAGSDRFEMLFTGGGIKHLTRETFAELAIPLIPFAEQQQIAACLSSLDALIGAQSQKLAGLQAHKQGLLQQLFPTPEEESR